MQHLLNKNAVLTGRIDFLCLVCEVYLVEEEAFLHIYKTDHKDNFILTQYSEKYQQDCIRKIKKIYYCEYCNHVLTTTTKVAFHVDESGHINNRNKKTLKRIDGDIVYGNLFRINDKAWNGLIEDTCVICNTEFDNEDDHRIDKSHILKLIQNDATTDYNESFVYRKLDDNTFHCLICNIVYTNKQLDDHVADQHHIENYQKSLISNTLENVSKKFETFQVKDKPETPGIVKTNNNKLDLTKDLVDSKPIQQVNLETNLKCEGENDTASKFIDIVEQSDNLNAKLSSAVIVKEETDINKLNNNQKVDINKKVDEFNTATLLNKNTISDDDIKKVLGIKNYFIKDSTGKISCFLCELDDFPGHLNHYHHQAILKLHQNRLKKKAEKISKQPNECNLVDENKDTIALKKEQPINLKPFDGENVSDSKENKCEVPEKIVTSYKNKTKQDELKCNDKPHKTEGNQSGKAYGSKGKKNGKVSDINGSTNNKKIVDELLSFAKQNDIDYNASNGNAFCRVCKSKIPSSITSIRAHVALATHTNKIKRIPKKTPMISFIRDISLIEIDNCRMSVINNEFVVNISSFNFWVHINTRVLKCLFCNIYFDIDDKVQHLYSEDHMKFITTPILEIKNQFIREMRPDEFHCGYCNQVYKGYENLEQHLQSRSHFETTLGSIAIRDLNLLYKDHSDVNEVNFQIFLQKMNM